MSFRDKMHPLVSNAEQQIRVELSWRKVKVFWQYALILDQTIPDFLLPKYYPVLGVPIFIDGPPHLKSKVQERDEYVDSKLEHLGYKPLRFPYTMPLSDGRLMEICDVIEEASK